MSSGNIGGVARPTRKLRARLETLYGRGFVLRMDRVVEDATTIDALAKVLDKAMTESVTSDGRLDLRDVAARILVEMRGNQR